MKLGNKGQVKTWLVGLLASAIVVTGGFFNSNLDNVLAALPSRLNDRQMQTFVDLGFNQTATRVVISGGQLMLDSTVNIEIGDVEPQLDNTDIQAVSLWARNIAPGDTSVFVDSDGHLQVDILSPTVAGNSAGAATDDGFLMLGVETSNGFTRRIMAVDSQGNVQVDIVSGGSMAAGAEQDVDDPAGATDTGNVMLVVRDNVLTTLTPVDNDYVRLRVDARGAQWVRNDPVDAQLDLQVAASATADGTTIDVSGVNLVLVHVINSGTWDRSGSLIFEGFMGVSPNPVERALPYIEFQGEGSGLATEPIGRRAQSQTLSTISSSELGFLVDVRGFQGFRARLTVTGGSAGTVSIHAHLVKNSEGIFNSAMALVQTSDGVSGVPDFSMLVVGEAIDGLVVDLGSNNDVTVSSSALPTGAATEATLDSVLSTLSDSLDELLEINVSVQGHEGDFNLTVDNIGSPLGGTDGFQRIGVVRTDVMATLPDPDGDYTVPRTDESGALWVRQGTVTKELFAAVSTTSSSTIVDVAGYTMGMIHYTNDANWDRTATFAINVSIGTSSPFKPVIGAVEVRQADTTWQHTDPEAISLVGSNRTRGYMINLMGFQALQVDVTVTAPGTGGFSEFHIHLYSSGSGFNQELSLGRDTSIDPVIGTTPPLIQFVGGTGSAQGIKALFLPSEDGASADGDAGIPAIVIRDDVLTAGGGTSTDLDYNMLRVDNFGALWSRPFVLDGEGSPIVIEGSGGRMHVAATVSSVIPGTGSTSLGKAEDAVAGSGYTGVASLGVANPLLAILAATGDFISPAMTTSGASITVPSYDGGVSSINRPIVREDQPFSGGDALMAISAVRDDVLTTLTPGDLEHTPFKVDSFGSAWSALTADDGARIPASSTTGLLVNTELPAAAALSDAIANPTTPMIGAAMMLFNPCGGTWERAATNGSGLQEIVISSGNNIAITSIVPTSSALALGKAEDFGSLGTDVGVAAMTIRDDVLEAGAAVGADLDYTWTRVDNFGATWTTLTDGAGSAVGSATGPLAVRLSDGTGFIDAAVLGTTLYTEATTTGSVIAAIRNDVLAALADTDNEMAPLQVDAFGALWNTPTDGAGNVLAKFIGTAIGGTDSGIPALVRFTDNDTPIAPAGAGAGWTHLQVDENGRQFVLSLLEDGTGRTLPQIEDVLAVTGDPGIMALGIVNQDLDPAAGNGDYVGIATGFTGAVLNMPVFESGMSQSIVGTTKEDIASANGHVMTVVSVIRDDALTADALVTADGDYTWMRVDNFGAMWTHENNAVQELGITELIGINEQVDAAEYSASVTTTLTGTGAITKVCLIATEDGSGAIRTPNGTLIIFDVDPAIVAGDTAITAGERTTILAQLTFSSLDYQEDANGASNCQATEEIYHTSTLFATWFLAAGEPSFNDVAGDDEQFEMNVLYRTDSL